MIEHQALQLDGLECEEALILVRQALRKNAGKGPLRITSSSATFHTLLTHWADATGCGLDPILQPTHGTKWELSIVEVRRV